MRSLLLTFVLAGVAAGRPDRESRAVFGRVVDRGGGGVSGASIQILDGNGSVLCEVATDSEGCFDVSGSVARQRRDAYAPLRTRAAKHGHSPREILVPFGSAGHIVLPFAERREGTVAGSGGPIAGAEVTASAAASDGGRYAARIVTDAEGRFSFADAAADVDTVYVVADGFLPASVRCSFGRPATVDLQPLPMRSVRGWVRDRRGKPIVGACVLGSPFESSRSDEDGVFELRMLTKGVLFGASGWRPAMSFVSVVADGYRPATAPLVETGALTVRLEPCSPLSRTLLDDRGDPVRGALVELLALRDGQAVAPIPFWPLVQRTAEDGTVRFSSVPAEPGILRLDFGPKISFRISPTEPDGVIRLSPAVRLSGRVVRGGGPVPGARVSAVGAVRDETFVFAPMSGLAELGHAFSDPDGRFELCVFDDRSVISGVFASLGTERSEQEQPLEGASTLAILPSLPLRGAVMDQFGVPLAGLSVQSASAGGVVTRTTTDKNGQFDLGVLRVETLSVAVSGDDIAAWSFVAWPGDRRALRAIRVRGPGRLAIQTDPVAESLAGATVTVQHGEYAAIHRTLVVEAGSPICFADLPVGRYSVVVDAEGYRVHSGGVDIAAEGAAYAVRLERGPPMVLLGEPGARVRIAALKGRRVSPEATLDDHGEARVYGFSAGRYFLDARKPGYFVVRREIDTSEPQAPCEVDLRSKRSCRVVVTVVDHRNGPVPGASVWVTSSGLRVGEPVVADARGEAALLELVEGEGTVSAEAGGSAGESTVTIGGGATDIAVRVRLSPD